MSTSQSLASTTPGDSTTFFLLDPKADQPLQAVSLKSLLEQRAAVVWEKYAGKDLASNQVIDELVIYTLEDRPIVKERITEMLEKRVVAKEFAKQVKLVSVKQLPQYSELLNTNMRVLTEDILATDPWLADRDLLSTTTTNPEIYRTKPKEVAKTEPAPPETVSQPQQGSTPNTFSPINPRERSDSASSPPRLAEAPSQVSVPSTKSSLPSQASMKTDKSSQTCGNPFRAFIKSKKSNDAGTAASPNAKSPSSSKNPFKGFVKPKSSENLKSQAIVPANGVGNEVSTPSKAGKPRKGFSLRWGFSEPFSPPKSASESAKSPEVLPAQGQNAAASKPNLQPFLDQSLSNTNLGSQQPVSQPQAESTGKFAEQRSIKQNDVVHTSPQREITSAPKSPKTPKAKSSSAQSPRRSNEVLDSVQELPNHASGPKSALPEEKVANQSYKAAVLKCKNDTNKDIALADRITANSPVTEYFIQEEEYRTTHEVIEKFVEHNYYLLEYVIKTIYRGERLGDKSVELLSRERMTADEWLAIEKPAISAA